MFLVHKYATISSMKKNTETVLAFSIVILIFVLLGSFLISRLDLYDRSSVIVQNENRISNPEAVAQIILEDRNRAEYISRNLHRGYFKNYDLQERAILIQAESRLGSQVTTEIKQFKINPNQKILCWPSKVPGTESPWQSTYIALEQNGYLFVNGEEEKTLNEIVTRLADDNYIFIHESGGVIQEIAVAGCIN